MSYRNTENLKPKVLKTYSVKGPSSKLFRFVGQEGKLKLLCRHHNKRFKNIFPFLSKKNKTKPKQFTLGIYSENLASIGLWVFFFLFISFY